MSMDIGLAGLIGVAVALNAVFVCLVSSCFKRCAPNQAMIVTGMLASDYSSLSLGGKPCKVLIGGGTTVFPIMQQADYMSLGAISIAVEPKTPYVTKDGAQIKFRAVSQVKVKADFASVLTAAELFLNKPESHISELVAEMLLAETRALAGTKTYTEILHDLRGFSHSVQENAICELAKMGLTVVSFSIDEMDSSPALLQSLTFEVAMKP